MKKIELKSVSEKKDTRNKVIMGVGLILLMILSVVGYAFYGSDTEEIRKEDYNGFKFTQEQGTDYWKLELGGQAFYFNHLPNETESFVSGFNREINSFVGKPLYFSEQNLGSQEIVSNIGDYVERIQLACLNECEEDLPVKNCSSNFIIFRESEENKIIQEDNCVYILSKKEDLELASDAFLYKILGIIN